MVTFSSKTKKAEETTGELESRYTVFTRDWESVVERPIAKQEDHVSLVDERNVSNLQDQFLSLVYFV